MNVCQPNTQLLSQTETVVDAVEQDVTVHQQPVLRLRLKKPKPDRKVGWKEGTVDNEEMGKKKSKCCCIYKKKHAFGESSSEDDEECENCFGHPEKRRRNKKGHEGCGCAHHHDDDSGNVADDGVSKEGE